MRELKEQFAKSDEPSFLIFIVASRLRKHPYGFLTIGLSFTLVSSWASQLRPLFHSEVAPGLRDWMISLVGVGQSELFLLASLILLVSSGKLRTGLAKALRALLGFTAVVFLMSSLVMYRWADFRNIRYPQMGFGLVAGLFLAALHFLMFLWATDPRTLRPYEGNAPKRPGEI